MMRHWLRGAVFLGAASLAAAATAQSLPGKDPAVFASTALTSEAGRQVRLGDFRGKVVFINFWGSWCPPCLQEMPSIQKMQVQLRDRANDVEYVFISIKTDWFERDVAKLRELGVTGHDYKWFPRSDAQWQAFFNDGPGKTHYNVPTSYVLDAAGNVALMRIQAVTWEAHAGDIRTILARR